METAEQHDIKLPRFSTGLKIMALALVIVVVLGVLFFVFGKAQFNQSGVELTVSGPEKAVAGEQVSYVVRYHNKNSVAIKNASLTFYYPAETLPLHAGVLAAVSKEAIDLGEIGPGGEGQKTFDLIMVGHKGSLKTARAVMNFVPGNLTAELQKTAELGTMLDMMPIDLTIVAPPTVVSGQKVSYFIDYKNQSDKDFRNLKIRVRLPSDFIMTGANPKSSLAHSDSDPYDIWEIPALNIGAGGRITIDGQITGRPKEVKTVTVFLQKEAVTEAARFPIDFEKTEASSVVSVPLLSVQLALGRDGASTAHLGDKLEYKITLTNNTDSDFTGLVLSSKLEGMMYDFGSLQSRGSFDSRTKTILWNSAVVPELGLLRAHQSVEVPFSVNLKDQFPNNFSSADSFIKTSAYVETFNVPEVFNLQSISASADLIAKITTAPAFSQELILNDQIFGSAAPFPPRVDQKTVFTIHWKLVNPSNEIRPAKVTGILLPGVTWENKFRTSGTQNGPVYNAQTSTLTWDVGNIPSGVGTSFPPYELYFQVSIVPSVNQVGQSPVLLRGGRFDGIDAITKENIMLTSQDINTSSAGGDGAVQQ